MRVRPSRTRSDPSRRASEEDRNAYHTSDSATRLARNGLPTRGSPAVQARAAQEVAERGGSRIRQTCWSPCEENHGTRGDIALEEATCHVGQPDAGSWLLACTGLAPKLRRHLMDLRESCGSKRVPSGEKASSGTHRRRSAQSGLSRRNEGTAFALGAEPQVLVVHDLGDGKGVMDLGHIDVAGLDSCPLVCGAARSNIEVKGRNVLDLLVDARLEDRRCNLHGASLAIARK